MVQHNAGMQNLLRTLTRHGQPVLVDGHLIGWLKKSFGQSADGYTVKYTARWQERRGNFAHHFTHDFNLQRERTVIGGQELWYLVASDQDSEHMHRVSGFTEYEGEDISFDFEL